MNERGCASGLLKRESLVLVGRNGLPVKNLPELLEIAKKDPERITYGSSGVGGISHLSMERMADLAGVKLNHIAYKGTGPALQDILGDTIDLMFSSVTAIAPIINDQRALGLAIADHRIPALPNVPTFEEVGIPEFKSDFWHAIAGPKGIPREIVLKLNAELKAVLETPEMQERIAAEGSQAVGSSPEELQQTIEQGIAQWKDVVQKAGIKAE
ncbi:Bug family tripartite tricarboxylate transporter substrate binding protein [Orrella sp. 11846]|uniref:Bug family tripartite tricarboxylate transporter substrate binding protein n=1 Tax=Orrella sp. 11846 TaxID=3409913 RepID=UPI003B598EBE